MQTVSIDERLELLNKIQKEDSFKAAYGISLTAILSINQLKPPETQHKICKEVVLTLPIVIYAKRNFYLTEKLNEKIKTLKAAGLTDYWQFQSIKENFLKFKEKSSAKVLSLTRLKGCFHVLIAGELLSILIFFLELVNSKLDNIS